MTVRNYLAYMLILATIVQVPGALAACCGHQSMGGARFGSGAQPDPRAELHVGSMVHPEGIMMDCDKAMHGNQVAAIDFEVERDCCAGQCQCLDALVGLVGDHQISPVMSFADSLAPFTVTYLSSISGPFTPPPIQ